jgi:hypothetical protein
MSVKLQIFHSKQCPTLKHVQNWIPRDIKIFPFDQEIHCYLAANISMFVGFHTFIMDIVKTAVFCILTTYSRVSKHWCFKETCWMFAQNASVYLHSYVFPSGVQYCIYFINSQLYSLRCIKRIFSNNFGLPCPRYSINLSGIILFIIKINTLENKHKFRHLFSDIYLTYWTSSLLTYQENSMTGPRGSN